MDQQPFPLPTFFVIGAPKAGTTSLHAYLARHPQVSMTRVKEPFVFAGEGWAERLPAYGELLDAEAPARGESSTVYSQYPHFGDVPARIAAAVPDARFIYLVRDPVDRALAHYRQRVANGDEPREPEAAFADHADPASVYLAASRYATQARLYLERFPAERLLVLEQDDLRDRRAETLARAFAFIGVDPAAAGDPGEARLNTAADLRLPSAAGRRLAGSRLVAAGRRLPLPGPARRAARRVLSRPVAAPELAPELRAAIAESLRDEVAWLREFTGRPFASWSL